MSNFVVSARKYRPTRFEDVVGQEHVSQTLKNALQNDHLAHAFLFCGPRGVGKTTCARILAKVLNCQNVTSNYEPCNTCDSCQAFNENSSFNIIELDAASNNSVDHIRQLVEQVRFQPQQGKYKVFIIDEVHMLSSQAFNAFLKTLEEPPPYAIFILATTEKHKIIPTILSRCQIFDFKRIQIADIVSHLENICAEENITAEKEALHVIAQKADGALRDALSIFDRIVSFSGTSITYEDVITNLNVLDYDYFFRFTDALLMEDAAAVMLIFNDVLNKGFEADIFITGLAEHLRNLLVCKDEATHSLLDVSENLKERYHQQATLAQTAFLLNALKLTNECDVNYRMARNKRLHVEICLLKMTYLSRIVSTTGGVAAPPAAGAPLKVSNKTSGKRPTVTKEVAAPTTVPTPKNFDAEAAVSNQTVAEPASSEKSATHATPPPPSGGFSLSLDNIDQSVQEETEQSALNATTGNVKSVELAQLKAAWDSYAQQSKSGSTRSVLKRAELTVIDPHTFQVTVASTLAKNTIQQDGSLMEYLRKELNCQTLSYSIVIDQSKAKTTATPKKQHLTDKQKLQLMNERNPVVKTLFERLGLTYDR